MSNVVLVVSTGKEVPWDVAFPGKTRKKMFDLMGSIKTLQMIYKHVSIAFDEEGTSLGVKGEHFFEKTYPMIMRGSPNYFEVAGREKQKKFDEVRTGLLGTKWWKSYEPKVMQAISTSRQSYENVFVVCLPGGPITDVERAEMRRIVKRMKSDNEKQKIRRLGAVQEMFCSSWEDFLRLVFESLGGGGVPPPFSSQIVRKNARQTYKEIVRVHRKCDLDALETLIPRDEAWCVLSEFDEDGKGELNEGEYVSFMLDLRRRMKMAHECQRWESEESSDSDSSSCYSD